MISYEIHHIGQENGHTCIVMLPIFLHKGKSKYFHTSKEPSKINRGKLASQKSRAWKNLTPKFEEPKPNDL